MEGLLSALEALPPIEALRFSRWFYAVVNTGQVLGVAMLVGGAVPLSLRLLGGWPDVGREGIVRILAATAGFGLALAVSTGFLLFATRATEYAVHPVFPVKIAFVLLGAASALHSHWRYGWRLEGASTAALRRAGVISFAAWVVALVLGRLVAFVGG